MDCMAAAGSAAPLATSKYALKRGYTGSSFTASE